MRPISLFRIVERAFGAASLGYQLYKEDDLKTEGENFAKVAEDFEKILGKGLVNKAIPNFWKHHYENFEKIMTDQAYGGVYQLSYNYLHLVFVFAKHYFYVGYMFFV